MGHSFRWWTAFDRNRERDSKWNLLWKVGMSRSIEGIFHSKCVGDNSVTDYGWRRPYFRDSSTRTSMWASTWERDVTTTPIQSLQSIWEPMALVNWRPCVKLKEVPIICGWWKLRHERLIVFFPYAPWNFLGNCIGGYPSLLPCSLPPQWIQKLCTPIEVNQNLATPPTLFSLWGLNCIVHNSCTGQW